MKISSHISHAKLSFCLLACLIAATGISFLLPEVSARQQARKAKAKAKVSQSTKAKRVAVARARKTAPMAKTTKAESGLNAFASVNPVREKFEQLLANPEAFGYGEETDEELREEEGKRADEPDKAIQFYLQKRLPEGEKELPVERYFEALEGMKLMPVHSIADNRLVSRAELRAAPDQQRLGTWTPLGPGNIGGRTRSILIHPQDPNIMYAGGVAGGVWKSTDAGASWTPIADLIANIAVCSLALDPKNPNIIYAGTGEGFNNADGVRGAGIFKTTDAGATWTRLASTANNSNFFFVNDLAVSANDSNRVYAATSTGVWRSLDAGGTWTQVLTRTASGGCHDLAARTDQTTDFLLAACGNFAQSAVFRKPDAEAAGAWESVLSDVGMGRTALAFAPSNQNVVYAISAAFSGTYQHGLHAFFRSDDGGAAGSWVARVRNTDANKVNTAILSSTYVATATTCQTGTTDSFSGQSWYDLTIAVDPLDPNRVWVGSIDLMRSDDGGANWGSAAFVYEGGGNVLIYGKPNQLHPDQHYLIFHPQYNGTTNQQLFVGNDGGIWRTDNARAAITTGPRAFCDPAGNSVRWTPLNNGYGVTQFYHGVVYPDGKTYFGGTQDNGTPRGSDADGLNNWKQIFLADGGYGAVDFTNPMNLYVSTQGGNFRRSTDGGATFSSATLGLSGSASFIQALGVDPSDPNRYYVLGDPVFRTNNGMANWTNMGTLRTVSLTTGVMTATAVAPTDANHVMFGMSDGSIVRTTRALALGPTNPFSATLDLATRPRTGNVSWIAYDPNDKNIAYATYSNFGGAHVFRTTNGGQSWTAIDGTGTTAIPDIPVHCLVVDNANPAQLYVGTDLGVFVSLDSGATWAVENTGFANVVTESLVLNTVGGETVLYAFTHGRGAYKVTANRSGCNYSLSQTGQAIAAAGSDLTVNVAAASGCSWMAASNVPWITLQPNSGGTGNGTVGLKVEANSGIERRFGTVAIAGRSFTVTQEGVGDVETPKITITNPGAPAVNTDQSTINVAGTASDNHRIASITWRTSNGVTGTASFNAAGAWTANTLPLAAGMNVLTFTVTDLTGNAVSTHLTVNARPASVLQTIAGSGVIGFDRDNVQAVTAGLTRPWRITFDGAGNLYIADDVGNRVRKVAPNGVITTVAGTGVAGFTGDGGQATQARLNFPSKVAVDNDGNLYIADFSNHRVRKVTVATGIITTIAGTGTAGFSGDGGPATEAQLNGLDGVSIGKDGNLYIADTSNHRVRRLTFSDGRISTVAGNGTTAFSGDGGDATAAGVASPVDVAFDSAGDLYIASSSGNRIRKVTVADGKISTVAGNGSSGFNGDGNVALSTSFSAPQSVVIDSANNLFISDRGNLRIRRINAADQRVSTLAGGLSGFTPDGGGAIGGRLGAPVGIALDPVGKLFFADTNNGRIRTVISAVGGDTTPPVVQITTISGSGSGATNNPLSLSGTAADNNAVVTVRWSNDRGGFGAANGTLAWSIPAITLQPGVNNLTITAWDASGNAGSVQVAVPYTPTQAVVTIAGTSVVGDRGDGGPGTASELNQPRGVAVDSKGNILVADTQNRRVRRISPSGQITAFAGTGRIGSGGDGGPAAEATLNFPNIVIVDKSDNVYISDQFTSRIRKVTPDGKISTIAGTGAGFGNFSGDGGPAKDAEFNGQVGLAVDGNGNLFVADRLNHRIRRIDAITGIITTVAGNGLISNLGDGGPATQASLNLPTGVAVDGAGNLYITDVGNQRIRRVSAADGKISTIAGTGAAGFSGDDGPAASALINLAYPATLTVDAAGELYFADRNNHRIRKINLSSGVISTVAGIGVASFNGDGTAPSATALSFPTSVAFDAAGNIIIADSGNNRIRRVRPANALRTLANVSAASFSTTAGLAAEEIAAAFGTNLSGSTVVASTVPLPTNLSGTTVAVRDSLGAERLAPLFFVSAEQINYLVPSGTANGIATVTVTNAAGEVATGTVLISTVAPSLFSANANGTGVAAAVVFRRNAAGQDSYEPVARFDSATGRFVAVPIDLGPEGDQVFLIPFGTGFRNLSGQANVQATSGGVNSPVIFTGAVPGLLGADQANLRLDRSLAGRGEIDVVLTVDGKTTNTVRVTIK